MTGAYGAKLVDVDRSVCRSLQSLLFDTLKNFCGVSSHYLDQFSLSEVLIL